MAIFVVVALVLALYSSHTFPFSKSHSTNVATKGSSATTTTTVPSTTSTTTPAKPESLRVLRTHLVARAAPAHATACSNPMTGTSSGASTTTTTIAAKGNAVATIKAPAGVGFPKLDGSAPHYTSFTAAPPFCIDASKTYKATIKTTAGTVVITLLPKYAPLTVNNFVFLAGYHFFDGTVFHRVITGFVDQGGDPTGTGTGGPGYKFANELPKSAAAYDAGSLAMANSGANTNGSQFFVTIGSGGQELANSYSMFGQVTSGIAVVNKINAGGSSSGTPKVLYKIISVHITVS